MMHVTGNHRPSMTQLPTAQPADTSPKKLKTQVQQSFKGIERCEQTDRSKGINKQDLHRCSRSPQFQNTRKNEFSDDLTTKPNNSGSYYNSIRQRIDSRENIESNLKPDISIRFRNTKDQNFTEKRSVPKQRAASNRDREGDYFVSVREVIKSQLEKVETDKLEQRGARRKVKDIHRTPYRQSRQLQRQQ